MKFEIRTEKGTVLFWTEHRECQPGGRSLPPSGGLGW